MLILMQKILLIFYAENSIIQVIHTYTANIFDVIFKNFKGVPVSTLILLYCLHLITAPSTVEKFKHWFTVVYCNIYTSTL